MRTLLLAALLILPTSLLAAEAGQDAYHHIKVSEFTKNRFTHVCTTGTVSYRRKQEDGDWHYKIMDGSSFIIAEEMPDLKAKGTRPKKGQKVMVCGVTRWDGVHQWNEIHPVREWRSAPSSPPLAPTPSW